MGVNPPFLFIEAVRTSVLPSPVGRLISEGRRTLDEVRRPRPRGLRSGVGLPLALLRRLSAENEGNE